MKTDTVIRSSASIRNHQVVVNGETVFAEENKTPLSKFLISAYKALGVEYSKFYKMDTLSQLGFLTSELMLTDIAEKSENTAIIIANAQSSLDTDLKYFDTIKDQDLYFPSPSLFVYTLPNIVMGEISIRNKFKGENAFFIFDKFECDFVCDYVNLLFETQDIDACITGWVDVKGETYDSFLYYVEPVKENTRNQYKAFIPDNL